MIPLALAATNVINNSSNTLSTLSSRNDALPLFDINLVFTQLSELEAYIDE